MAGSLGHEACVVPGPAPLQPLPHPPTPCGQVRGPLSFSPGHSSGAHLSPAGHVQMAVCSTLKTCLSLCGYFQKQPAPTPPPAAPALTLQGARLAWAQNSGPCTPSPRTMPTGPLWRPPWSQRLSERGSPQLVSSIALAPRCPHIPIHWGHGNGTCLPLAPPSDRPGEGLRSHTNAHCGPQACRPRAATAHPHIIPPGTALSNFVCSI